MHDEEYHDIVEACGYDGRLVLAWHESDVDDRLTLDSLAVNGHARAPANHRSSKSPS